PEDCDLLVIAGPKSDLEKSEREIIQNYLRKGGDALFLIEHTLVTTPAKPLSNEELLKNPSLNAILNEWGVNVLYDIVVDLASHAGEDVGSPATNNYMPHKGIIRDLDYTFYVRPRSISVVDQRRPTIKVAPVVLTMSKTQSWGESHRELEVKYDEGIDFPGPVPISYVMWEPKDEGDLSDTRIMVFTDADFLTNLYIGFYSNAQMGLNAINWLTEVDYQSFVETRDLEVTQLKLTSLQKRRVIVILVLIPIFIGLLGLMVWSKNSLS
ncbi:MAG: Gldg family protein, partial [Candidatus Omnitrophica bacterium]|nr:Gldg family protein [Candidatus Omnitrophota bacterium]